MADEHQRYERLAVGHVVGGLDEVDAARFRSHLVACRDCRTTVAELRGIADDLAATEREERAVGTGRTEVAERVEADAPPRTRPATVEPSWPWRILAIGLVPLIVLGALAWAVWIRAENQVLGVTVRTQAEVLEVIAEGELLAVSAEVEGVTGVVAVRDGVVAVDVGNLPEPGPDETITVGLRDGDGEQVGEVRTFVRSQLPDGRLFARLDVPSGGAAELLVQRARVPGPDGAVTAPQDLVSASLPAREPPGPTAGSIVGPAG